MSSAPTAKPAPKRPVPVPNTYFQAQPYWDGVKQKKLMLQYCPDTKQYQFFPRPVSNFTGKANLEWRESKQKGTIYAMTLTRVPMGGFEDRVPYPIVTVDLDEKVRMIGLLLNCKPEEAKIGDRVKVCWEALTETQNYPSFELDR